MKIVARFGRASPYNGGMNDATRWTPEEIQAALDRNHEADRKREACFGHIWTWVSDDSPCQRCDGCGAVRMLG